MGLGTIVKCFIKKDNIELKYIYNFFNKKCEVKN